MNIEDLSVVVQLWSVKHSSTTHFSAFEMTISGSRVTPAGCACGKVVEDPWIACGSRDTGNIFPHGSSADREVRTIEVRLRQFFRLSRLQQSLECSSLSTFPI
jgi:hypothetical protein